MRLVFGTLGEEQKPFAGLTCVSDIMFSDLWFFAFEVIRERVRLNRLVAKPKELLGETETPEEVVKRLLSKSHMVAMVGTAYFTRPGAL